MLTKKKLSFFLIVLIVFVFSFPAFAVIDYPSAVSVLPYESQYHYYIEFEYLDNTTISDSRHSFWRYVVFFEDVEDLIFPVREVTNYNGQTETVITFSTSRTSEFFIEKDWKIYRTTDYDSRRNSYSDYEFVYHTKTLASGVNYSHNFRLSDVLRSNFDIVAADGTILPGQHDADYYVVDEVGYLSSEQKYQLLEWEKKWEQNVKSQFFIYFPDPSLVNDYNAEEIFYNFSKTRSPSGRGTVTLMFYEDNGKWDGYIGFSGRFAMQLPDMKHESILLHVNESLDTHNSLMSFIRQYVRRQYESIIYDDAEKVPFLEGLFNRTVWTKKFKNLVGFGTFKYVDRDAGAYTLCNAPIPHDEILFMESEYYYDSYSLFCGLDKHDNHIWRISTWFTDVPSLKNVTPSPLPEPTPYLPPSSDVPFPLPTEPYDDTDWRVPDFDVPNFRDLIYRKFPVQTFERTWEVLNRDYERLPPSFTINLRELAESAGATGSSLSAFPDEDIELADWTLFSIPFLDVTILEFLRTLLSAIIIWNTLGFVYREIVDNTF